MLPELIITEIDESIKFNNWGGINYKEYLQNKEKIPRKVFSPLTKHPVAIDPTRELKPKSKNGFGKDIFEKIIKGEWKEIVIAYDGQALEKRLFECKPKEEYLGNYKAVALINKFPIGFRCVTQEVYDELSKNSLKNGVYLLMPSLVCFITQNLDNEEYQKIENVKEEYIYSLLLTMKSTINAYIKKAQDNELFKVNIYSFINQGLKVKSSQKRLHSQILIDLTQTDADPIYRIITNSFRSECPICKERNYIYENEGAKAWFSEAPSRPYEVIISPKNHKKRFEDLNKDELKSLADILIKTNKILSEKGAEDRVIQFNSLNYGENSNFHFYIDIIPFSYMGAFGYNFRFPIISKI